MVKRYSVVIDGADPNGNLVKYDDYASLEAKIALLEVQLKLSEAAERAWESSMMQACGEDGPKSVADKFAELESKLETALRECRSAGITIDNLDGKCAELAAELSQAKSVVSECREYFIAGIMNRIRPTNEGYLHMRCDTLGDETPSHDAFLAEVRAQGVEMYADNLDKVAVDAERGGFDYAVKFLRSEASSVRLFADQLRKGGNQ